MASPNNLHYFTVCTIHAICTTYLCIGNGIFDDSVLSLLTYIDIKSIIGFIRKIYRLYYLRTHSSFWIVFQTQLDIVLFIPNHFFCRFAGEKNHIALCIDIISRYLLLYSPPIHPASRRIVAELIAV